MKIKRELDERQMKDYEEQNKKFVEWQKKVQPQLQENAALKDKCIESDFKVNQLEKKVGYITTVNAELGQAKTELLGQLTRLQTSLGSRQEELDELRRALKSEEMKKILHEEKQKYKELERLYG
jgi:predicted nuclease with TOPRIM domain